MSNEAMPKLERELIVYFVLTYLITWALGAFLFLLPGPFEALFGETSMSSPVFVLAVAAPTISATIITYSGGNPYEAVATLKADRPGAVQKVWIELVNHRHPAGSDWVW